MARIYKILARSHTGAVEFVVRVVHLVALCATRNSATFAKSKVHAVMQGHRVICYFVVCTHKHTNSQILFFNKHQNHSNNYIY